MCFSHQELLKMNIQQTKNTRVRFFICMSSMCVQLFTAFEEAVLKSCMYLGECPKIKDGHHFQGNEAREKIVLFFSPYFFILIIINVQ